MLRVFVLKALKFYQLGFAFLKPQPSCKFYPTCSQYAIEVVQKYGVWKGLAKASWRILRCNPWHHGGVDKP